MGSNDGDGDREMGMGIRDGHGDGDGNGNGDGDGDRGYGDGDCYSLTTPFPCDLLYKRSSLCSMEKLPSASSSGDDISVFTPDPVATTLHMEMVQVSRPEGRFVSQYRTRERKTSLYLREDMTTTRVTTTDMTTRNDENKRQS